MEGQVVYAWCIGEKKGKSTAENVLRPLMFVENSTKTDCEYTPTV